MTVTKNSYKYRKLQTFPHWMGPVFYFLKLGALIGAIIVFVKAMIIGF